MPAGTLVTLGIGAANRDPDAVPRSGPTRLARTPNRHLAFGSGIHMCAGMSLARLEGRVAIGRFLRAFPTTGSTGPARGGRARFRGFPALPVRLT